MDLAQQFLPKLPLNERIELLKKYQSMLNKLGVTSIQDAWVEKETFDTYAAADRAGSLTLRVKGALYVDSSKDEAQVADLIKMRDSVRDCRLFRAETVKMFADGVIEPRTAAMLKPYLDRPGYAGNLNYDPNIFARLATAFDANGFQVHIHAIGDRAVRAALDSLEAAEKANGRRDARHTIAHLQVVQPEDRLRFRPLGVIANFEPYWSQADDYMVKQTEPALGKNRSLLQYPLASIAKTGALITGGSDWPVSTMNPFEEMEVAITHQDPYDKRAVWNPAQRVDLNTILAAYTINGAYACRQEKETGSLEVGKLADIVVLDRNLFAIAPDQIHATKVLLTMFDGKPIYDALGTR